ncbi:C4-dicarboxylate ABC transporter [Pseudomonas agarici]|uniref:TRAP transporter large permease protein n=1 Tax=Pseudomonas agarici TaxID=46677 RepID=A0A0X1T7V5_PSEAA|nr:TRAP transporter large permease [Pseudomonas agarici]AMB88151.1 C4-dicarboxylate ABC transporter [Pseudomonas agarici]NWB93584.1 TRAP transporter large permease [Pseudomonas agarici]NWC11113.1 TRAP transporter large permease [Pseudomonas agarici]SEL58382.1 TRAP transporter, DctM subunit [Pseudomonas agarici]
MSELELGALLFVVTFAVLFSGIPIAFGLILVSVAFLYCFGDLNGLAAIPTTFVGELSNFALLTIPLFVLLGCAIGASRAGKDLYDSLHRWMCAIPGGLVIANIMGTGLFAAMCGSSPATAAAIGRVGIPEMIRRNVPPRLATGAIAAGGTLGILIPPSLTFIIYGIITHTSIARLFLAGVVPGIMLLVIFAVYAWASSYRQLRNDPQQVTERYTLSEKMSGLIRILPFLAIIISVTVVMYGGFATPSEVAAIAAFLALVLVVVVYRTWHLAELWTIMREAVRESCMILMIVAGAAVYAYMMSYLYITQSLAQWMFSWNLSNWELILVLNVFLLIAGFFLPAVSIILMSMPVILPVLVHSNIDLIWFAVMLTINLEIGLIHPPMGLNLFVIRGVAPQVALRDIMMGALPFVAILLAFIVLLAIVPGIATGLPDLLMGPA